MPGPSRPSRSPRSAPALVLLALACATAAPPIEDLVPSSSSVPIRDRYARSRLVLLDAVNADRAAAGVPPVALDSLATVVAQAHAEEMARGGYLSHYEADGSAPYERYSQAGGTEHVRENVFRWEGKRSGPDETDWAWPAFDVRRAEGWLMESDGHRATILDGSRTHVGLGIAESEDGGAVYVVQEFIARHARLEVPALGWRGAQTVLRGRMAAAGTRPLLVFLSPEPIAPEWGTGPPPGGPYADGGAEGILVPPWAIRWNRSDRSFEVPLALDRAAPHGRWYGIVYVATEPSVRQALGRRVADSRVGWPGAAFVLDVL